ncbi:hypothetical protein [Blastococcus jejuensis]|uniref:hypothetical protein n=1 Tax=Blastococcus jejuensis TaxID=351224 RepID=UPI0031D3D6CD
MSPIDGRARASVLLKALAALAVGAAWATLGRGLLAGPHDGRVWDDLDAGGRFAVNLTYYLPYLLLSIAVAIVVVAGLLPRSWPLVSLAGTVGLVVLADAYVLSSGVLRDAQPQLLRHCLLSSGVALLAGVALVAARTLRTAPLPEGVSRP